MLKVLGFIGNAILGTGLAAGAVYALISPANSDECISRKMNEDGHAVEVFNRCVKPVTFVVCQKIEPSKGSLYYPLPICTAPQTRGVGEKLASFSLTREHVFSKVVRHDVHGCYQGKTPIARDAATFVCR